MQLLSGKRFWVVRSAEKVRRQAVAECEVENALSTDDLGAMASSVIAICSHFDRHYNEALLKTENFGARVELILLMSHIFLGQIKDAPKNIPTLVKLTRMARSTLVRKLDLLEKVGIVEFVDFCPVIRREVFEGPTNDIRLLNVRRDLDILITNLGKLSTWNKKYHQSGEKSA